MKKIITNEQTFTFFTERKTAPCCNGTGTHQTNYGIDECGYCLGSGDFKDAFNSVLMVVELETYMYFQNICLIKIL